MEYQALPSGRTAVWGYPCENPGRQPKDRAASQISRQPASSDVRKPTMSEGQKNSSSSSSTTLEHVCFAAVTAEFYSHCLSEQEIHVSFLIWCSVDTSISVSSVFCLQRPAVL